MKRYVIYQRVSTDEQAEKGYSLEAMLEKCQHYIKSQEDGVLVRTYEDKGYSGTLPPSKRPALNQLLEDLKTKAVDFDAVLLWKLDRLSRSMRDTLNIEYILRRANKTLESVTERLDTSTAAGKMFFNAIASFAEFESAQTADRTRNAMSSRVGRTHLGGKAPLGYRLAENKFVKDLKTAHIVEMIFKKFLILKNYSRVADYLNRKQLFTSYNKQFSHKKIQRILINPAYNGVRCWGRRNRKMWRNNPSEKWIYGNSHEPIISQKTFQRVQAVINAGRTKVCVSGNTERRVSKNE